MNVLVFDEDAVLAAFFSSALFLIGYSALAPWWRHPIGRGFASLDFALLLAMAPGALHYLLGLSLQHVFFAWYYGASLLLVAVITVWRLAVIATVQRQVTPRHGASGPPVESGTD